MKRIVASFLLLSYLNLIFFPTSAWALSITGIQPEYMGFGSLNSNEMVDPFTGDMSLNIPLLHVPGPEGGYSLPLSYNAGISPEQEASWVGLGWNLNAGSINREAVQYPDDFKGQEIYTKYYMPKQRINTNIQLFLLEGGNAYLSSGLNGTKFGITVEDAVGNSIGLFDASGNASLLGVVNYSKTEGQAFASSSFSTIGVVNLVMTALSVFTFGASIAVKASAKVATTAASASLSATTQAFNVITTTYSAIMLIQTLAQVLKGTRSTSEIGNEIPIKSQTGCTDIIPTLFLGFNLRQCVYEIEIDHTKKTKAFGALYLGSEDKVEYLNSQARDFAYSFKNKAKFNGNSIALKKFDSNTPSKPSSDVFQYLENAEYSKNETPIFLAKDLFLVQGEGVGGRIEPFKLESSEVSIPVQFSKQDNFSFSQTQETYKPQFRYSGVFSNYYNYNKLKNTTGSEDLNSGIELNHSVFKMEGNQPTVYMNFTIKDLQINGEDKISPPREGFFTTNQNSEKNKLALNKNVNWFTNAEISNFNPTTNSSSSNLLLASNYIDFLPYSQRKAFRDGKPNDGIGGFSITREDGMTYHYTLPVYKNLEVNFSSRENPFHSGINNIDIVDGNFYQTADAVNMITVNNNPYAVSWLLTAITGSDFVDRGELGIIDDQDLGHWVKFEYGRFSDRYAGRLPYSKDEPEYVMKSVDNVFKSYADTKSEIYYLDAIKTRSHIALFSKSLREDCIGVNVALTNGEKRAVPSLRLDNIYLLTKQDFEALKAIGFSNATGNSQINPVYALNGLYDTEDFSNSSVIAFLKNKALRKIGLSYDYSLCKNVPNNIEKPSGDEGTGKLTLKKISIYGKGDLAIHPDYELTYSNNPDYNYEIDAWGQYYKNDAATAKNSKQISPMVPRSDEGTYNVNTATYLTTGSKPTGYTTNSFDAAAWSLDKIIMPNGIETEFLYERDSYSSIAGVSISTYYPGETNRNGGGIRVAQITTKDPVTQAINKLTYRYSNEDGTSSGVAAIEPEVIAKDFYSANTDKTASNYKKYTKNKVFFNYPNLPITYKRVEIYNGLPIENKFLIKEIMSYITLDSEDMFSISSDNSGSSSTDNVLIGDDYILSDIPSVTNELSNYLHIINCNFSNVGRLVKKERFNNHNEQIYLQTLTYSNMANNQIPIGVFQENLFAFVSKADFIDHGDYTYLYKYNQTFNRTLNKEISSYLSSITTTQNGVTTQISFSEFDLITGMPTVSIMRDSYGNSFKMKNELAFTKYPQMGSKAENQSNKNMLSQVYGVYNYLLDQTGTESKLLNAKVSTFANDMDVLTPTGNGVASQSSVWRNKSNYVWIGDNNVTSSNDGTFDLATFNTYRNSLTDVSKWQKVNETKLVDSYSHPLEVKDVNGISHSTLYEPKGRFAIASVQNASYNEIAFSGAEGMVGNSSEGNVQNIEGILTNVDGFVHTGKYSIMVNPGKEGFRATLKATKFIANKKYRASVWVYYPGLSERNLLNTELYYEQGSTKGKVTATPNRKAGSWYLLDLVFSVPNNSSDVTIGIKNLSTQLRSVYVDDFRVAPLNAQMNCSIVDYDDFSIVANLDNDHLYTRFEYDVAGRVTDTYAERIGKPVEQRLGSNKYNFVK